MQVSAVMALSISGRARTDGMVADLVRAWRSLTALEQYRHPGYAGQGPVPSAPGLGWRSRPHYYYG